MASMVTEAFHLRPPAVWSNLKLNAREDYSAGLKSLRRDSKVSEALASLERAVRADPDSALTYAGLAEAQWFEFFLTNQRVWLERSAVSAREAERRNLAVAQEHRVAGLHFRNEGLYEQAANEYLRAIELEPRTLKTTAGSRRFVKKITRTERPLRRISPPSAWIRDIIEPTGNWALTTTIGVITRMLSFLSKKPVN